MASDVEAHDNELSIPVDYVPGARGHAVLAVGPDSDGGDSLAVWRLTPTGRAGGAWIVRFDEIERNADQLCRIMGMLQGRCLVEWSSEAPASILGKIGDAVPADLVAALQSNILTIPDLLTEIREQRTRYAEAVEQHRATTKSKIAPLEWPSVVPDQQELTEWAVRAQSAVTSPVAASALVLTAVVARTAQLWQDTEQARYRRGYLRSFGEPQALPPRWLARLRAAAGSAELVPA